MKAVFFAELVLFSFLSLCPLYSQIIESDTTEKYKKDYPSNSSEYVLKSISNYLKYKREKKITLFILSANLSFEKKFRTDEYFGSQRINIKRNLTINKIILLQKYFCDITILDKDIVKSCSFFPKYVIEVVYQEKANYILLSQNCLQFALMKDVDNWPSAYIDISQNDELVFEDLIKQIL